MITNACLTDVQEVAHLAQAVDSRNPAAATVTRLIFETVDQSAQQVLEAARQEAALREDGAVGTEHLLLALATADRLTRVGWRRREAAPPSSAESSPPAVTGLVDRRRPLQVHVRAETAGMNEEC